VRQSCLPISTGPHRSKCRRDRWPPTRISRS
jgi:hypothetical protein